MKQIEMKNPSGDTVVALFVRVPIPGQVKTRLASTLGNERACRFYQAIVEDILFNIQACDFPVYLFHDGVDGCELPEKWSESAARVIAQKGECIGERMAAAFECCFAEGIKRVVLVGSDIPRLDARVVLAASAALESHDVAVVPAVDGGYCLIALTSETYQAAIFQNVPWSTEQVLSSTIERCQECHLEAELLEPLQDIDTLDDLLAYCRTPFSRAIATNNCLEAAGFLESIDVSRAV